MERERDGGFGIFLLLFSVVVAAVFLADAFWPLLFDLLRSFARFEALVAGKDEAFHRRLDGLGHEESDLFWPLFAELGIPFALGASVLILLLLCLSWRLSCRERYARIHSMASLLARNRAHHPCLAPILAWPRSLLEEPLDRGPWMCARQPLQFAAEHGLLRRSSDRSLVPAELLLDENGLPDPASPLRGKKGELIFDAKRARTVFEGQFGPRFKGFFALGGPLLALSLAFALFGLDRKEESMRILNDLARGFMPPGKRRGLSFRPKPPFLLLAGRPGRRAGMAYRFTNTREEISSVLAEAGVIEAVRPHNQYTYLVILALYAFARRKGVLGSAEFIWLKPLLRPLFYLLNNFGRRTVWVEVAGPVVHYRAEEALSLRLPSFQGVDMEEKCVWEAVCGLERALMEEGWLG
ncbi:MAG: hypothetical protein K5657_07875 [Desulfovibrio sp.]|nr:hypothetical protein [Desulfovibrio sp.]